MAPMNAAKETKGKTEKMVIFTKIAFDLLNIILAQIAYMKHTIDMLRFHSNMLA